MQSFHQMVNSVEKYLNEMSYNHYVPVLFGLAVRMLAFHC